MDDVNAAVEEHKEQGRLSKWWTGVTSSKTGAAIGNHGITKALTYVSSQSAPPHYCSASSDVEHHIRI